jgi:hypothetical protein
VRRNLLWVLLGVFLLGSYLASSALELTVDYVWMEAMGFAQVFSTIVLTRLGLALAGGLLACAVLYGNLSYALRQIGDPARYLPPELAGTPLALMLGGPMLRRLNLGLCGAVGLVTGLAASGAWRAVLLYFNGGSFNSAEPVFHRDAGFYVFALPLYERLQTYLWSLGVLTLLGVVMVYLIRLQAERSLPSNVISVSAIPARARTHMAILASVMLLLLAAGLYLDRFSLLHEAGGLFTGPGYADLHAVLPVLALKLSAAVVAAGLVLYALPSQRYRWLIAAAGLMVVVWVGGGLYASLMQRFVVSPNELEKERPYLKDHIQATLRGFGLENVQERPLKEDEELSAADIARNGPTINNVRLWDHEPLLETFSQIQEIRTYYDFVSVDNDRYRIGGELRQTMLSPREMNSSTLPSRTWVNERLTFTHGYGLTLGPVNRVNEQGLPVLFVQDLPPKAQYPELAIRHPEIYFGEVVDDYVFVKTRQQEFNYPQGDANIFSTYDGSGGVSVGSVFRRVLFALYLKDMKMLLADDFTPDTRVLLFRNIVRRVSKIAPFLQYDRDPYMVIYEGRLVWILDAYTISGRYPYSEQVADLGNYIRNSVKVVVDAKDGSMRFYLVDGEEPIARAYARAFPGMFHPLAEMPAGLRAHLRQPEDLFTLQTQMYATYHMQEASTFYNKEDQWSVPVVGQKRMAPYYTVMKLPGEAKEEFILMLPFTPRLKDNLAAWMVARSDGEQYGKLLVYTFPKQKLIFGPKQMVARINQDPVVSQQITLWDASGSAVIRGTLLVIPIENSLIYVQPIYLKAVDGRIPELKRVVVGYGNEIAMGEDLEAALGQIFGGGRKPGSLAGGGPARQAAVARPAAAQPQPPGGTPVQRLAREAMQHYNAMTEATRQGDWARFGREMDALGRALRDLAK